MSVLKGLRRMFGQPRVVELDASTAPTPSAPSSDAAGDIEVTDKTAEAIKSMIGDPSPPQPARRDAQEMLESIDRYDERMRSWYRRQGIDTPDWSTRIERHFQERHRTRNAEWYREVGADFD